MIAYLLNPFPYVALLVMYLWVKRRRPGRNNFIGSLFFSFLVFYLFTTPFLIHPLVQYLEDQHTPIALQTLDTNSKYHIIVLGAGHGYDRRLPPNSRLNATALMRLVEGIRIYRSLPHSLLITSANSAYGLETQASVMRGAAIALGVDSSRIRMLVEPYNTESEAQSYVAHLGRETPLIIATTAKHMPRAIDWFEKKGVKNIIPAPTDFVIKKDQPFHWGAFIPSFMYFDLWQNTLKEFSWKLLKLFC